MRHRHRDGLWRQGPRVERPLGGDIVALLGQALRQEEYAAAEHLLQALEELEKDAAESQGGKGRSPNLNAAYLEIARSLGTKPTVGGGKRSVVELPTEHRRDKP